GGAHVKLRLVLRKFVLTRGHCAVGAAVHTRVTLREGRAIGIHGSARLRGATHCRAIVCGRVEAAAVGEAAVVAAKAAAVVAAERAHRHTSSGCAWSGARHNGAVLYAHRGASNVAAESRSTHKALPRGCKAGAAGDLRATQVGFRHVEGAAIDGLA